jgi:EAL domain-containing protein (putative c-di-GMP-specific phosphodiesterase class I)
VIDEVPAIPSAFGDLYLRFPTAGTAVKARILLETLQYQPLAQDDFILALERVEAPAILRALAEHLTVAERADSLALLKPAGLAFGASDILYGLPIQVLRDRLSAGWLIELLRARDLTVVFQPIVDANAPTTVFAYEALVRGRRTGEAVTTGRMLEVARHAALLTHFDHVAATCVLSTILEQHISATVFVNILPNRIYDPQTWIAHRHQYWTEQGIDPSRIVFEFMETEHTDVEHIQLIARIAQEHGYRVALDDLGAGYASLNMLARLKPDFVKFDLELTQNVHDPFSAVIFSQLIDATTTLGVPTIAEGIETQAQLDWARRNGITYVQGYFTGKPGTLTA